VGSLSDGLRKAAGGRSHLSDWTQHSGDAELGEASKLPRAAGAPIDFGKAGVKEMAV